MISVIPNILEYKIFSLITILTMTSDRKGVRYIRLFTCAVVRENFRAFIQITKVIPISNNPIYIAPIIPLRGGKEIFWYSTKNV